MINESNNATTQQTQTQVAPTLELPKPLPTLSMPFPMVDYHVTRDVMIPFNLKDSNEGKFHTPEDAMFYIRDHLLRNGITFKRSTALRYCQLCQVYEQADGGYFCMTALGQSQLNRVFTKISRLASTRIAKQIAKCK